GPPAARPPARRPALDQRCPLTPAGGDTAAGPAPKFRFADMPAGPAGVGLIAPVTRSFCGACSRLRITADGKIRPCLFSRDEWDIRPVLRRAPQAADEAGQRDAALAAFIRGAVWQKQAGHGITAEGFA